MSCKLPFRAIQSGPVYPDVIGHLMVFQVLHAWILVTEHHLAVSMMDMRYLIIDPSFIWRVTGTGMMAIIVVNVVTCIDMNLKMMVM